MEKRFQLVDDKKMNFLTSMLLVENCRREARAGKTKFGDDFWDFLEQVYLTLTQDNLCPKCKNINNLSDEDKERQFKIIKKLQEN